MKKFDITKAIKNNDRLILCKAGSGLVIRFEEIHFIEETPTKQLVFATKAGKMVVLKPSKYNASKYDTCGKYSDCWVDSMDIFFHPGRFGYNGYKFI